MFGNFAEARQAADAGLKLYPNSKGVQAEAALAYAMVGDNSRADSLSRDLNRRFPVDSTNTVALASRKPSATEAEPQAGSCGNHSSPSGAAAHRVRPDQFRREHFLPLSDLHSRTGVPVGGAREGSRNGVPEDSRPQRNRLELLDGSAGAVGHGSRKSPAGGELNEHRHRCCPRHPRRILSLFYPLERLRSRHSNLQGS